MERLRTMLKVSAHPVITAVCLLASVWLLSGCNALGKGRLSKANGAGSNADREWLCEAGKDSNDWDCIESEDIEPLLAKRAASRSESSPASDSDSNSDKDAPAQQEASNPALQNPPSISDPLQSPIQTVPGPQVPQTIPTSAPVPDVPSPERPFSSSASSPLKSSVNNSAPAPRPITTATPALTDEPAYAQLAYRPPEPMRIIDLPENFYAAQLLAVATKKQIEDFVVDQELHNMAAARIEQDGQLKFVLLLGVYETKDIAQAAVAQMPSQVRSLQPWVRPIDGLQEAMLRADRLASTAGRE